VLTLSDPSGNIIDQKEILPMQLNNTFGRRSDGTNNWYYFDTPSPDTTNMLSAYYTGYTDKPIFSKPAGFYTGSQVLALNTMDGVVRYTLNGADPDQTSALFTGALTIDTTTVVRARTFSSDPLKLPGEIVTNTYFINESISLPVVSLTSDPYNLFDYYYGIYVMGPNADTTSIPFHGANFWQGWERPGNIEFFEDQETFGFETPASIAIQGNYSKAWPQRGFAVKAKENFNGSTINYPLFPDKLITEYKSFNIRNAGSDWNGCHMRDRFNQKVVQNKTNLDIMDGRPCVLFINGVYWGVYELREKQDKDYIENNSGVSADKIDFLQFDGSIIEGSNTEFLNMSAFIGNNDMSIPANYSLAKNMLDIENFCDYFITETFVVNIDWLGSYTNNIKFWRPNNPPGKWRYVLWDTDLSMGFAEPLGTGYDTMNMLSIAIDPTTLNPHSTILKGLLDNTEFKNYFVDRYADLMNTIFQPAEMQKKAFELRDEMSPEMGRHFNLWGGTSPLPGFIGNSVDVLSWESAIDTMLNFGSERIMNARNYIQSEFGLVKQVDVTLDVVPANAGKIKISTIVPEGLPWTGVYFDGVPVTLTALANPGYEFKFWEKNSNLSMNDSISEITLNIDSSDVFKAHFTTLENNLDVFPNPFSDHLTINFQLPEALQVSLKMYSILGQEVTEIISPNAFQTEGLHTITFDVNDIALAQGLYFVELKTKHFSKTVKLVRSNK
ncbi:MAG: CotH kinase family protein, partial [Bacteroidota bacterium]|nr:CotH kinase family protein [Bacteroidota bacterium]